MGFEPIAGGSLIGYCPPATYSQDLRCSGPVSGVCSYLGRGAVVCRRRIQRDLRVLGSVCPVIPAWCHRQASWACLPSPLIRGRSLQLPQAVLSSSWRLFLLVDSPHAYGFSSGLAMPTRPMRKQRFKEVGPLGRVPPVAGGGTKL